MKEGLGLVWFDTSPSVLLVVVLTEILFAFFFFISFQIAQEDSLLKCLPENEQTEAMREAGIQICVCSIELSQAIFHFLSRGTYS